MFHRTKQYDIIVVGSGAGASIVDAAISAGRKVAWADRGPLGGTCLNVGCIPTKMLVEVADRIMEIREAGKLGVTAEIQGVDFAGVMARMRRSVGEGVAEIRHGLEHAPKNLDFYETEAHFVAPYTLDAGGRRIQAETIFLASGARPLIPPIRGLAETPYLTNETALALEERPASMLILGGGYIACEFAHFFAAMGTQVTIVGRNPRLLPDEEPEISDLVKIKMAERMAVHTGVEAIEVGRTPAGVRVVGREKATGALRDFEAEALLVAVGRQSNADRLQVEKAGIEVDAAGYIKTQPHLETNQKGIWAFGDALGKHMYRHVANEQANLVWHNFSHGHNDVFATHAVPHAVFCWPQVAGVGMTEREARQNHQVLVGQAGYMSVAKGEAMLETDGFAKVILEKETYKILGFHIVGPQASVLIQEVIGVMAMTSGEAGNLFTPMHIHPALSELILRTFSHLHE
jgi:dihydrolipoamide dehydrogenase